MPTSNNDRRKLHHSYRLRDGNNILEESECEVVDDWISKRLKMGEPIRTLCGTLLLQEIGRMRFRRLHPADDTFGEEA